MTPSQIESQIELEGAALVALLKAIKPFLKSCAIPTDSRGHRRKGIVLVDFGPDGDTRLVLARGQLVWEKKDDVYNLGGWGILDFSELTPLGAVTRFSFARIIPGLAENLAKSHKA